MRYRILVRGVIPASWFGELQVSVLKGTETILQGEFADQAALFGVLRRIRDLGIELQSVQPVGEGETE